MSKTKKKSDEAVAPIILITVLVAVVALVITGLIGNAMVHKFQTNLKVIDKKSTAEKQLKANLDALHSLSSQYDQLGDAKKVISDGLPNKPDFPALSSLMENIAKQSGIGLVSVATDDGASTGAAPANTSVGSAQQLNFQIEVQGSYGALLKLMQNIEVSARPMRVTNITVDGASEKLSVKLAISTYYQPASTLELKKETVQ
jgi:Tfp pilus assembly protein PilO